VVRELHFFIWLVHTELALNCTCAGMVMVVVMVRCSVTPSIVSLHLSPTFSVLIHSEVLDSAPLKNFAMNICSHALLGTGEMMYGCAGPGTWMLDELAVVIVEKSLCAVVFDCA
jgi:hypothetical protein